MTTITTNPGVNHFETGGPDGDLITIVADTPLTTDDERVVAILRENGAHALTISDAAPASVADNKPVDVLVERGARGGER
jgi:hypothetical protein